MKQKTIILSAFLAIFALILIVGSVSAFSGFGKSHGSPDNKGGFAMFGVNQTEIQNAIKNNDYASWKSLIESQLTEENFNKLVEMSKNFNMTGVPKDMPQFNPDMNQTGDFREKHSPRNMTGRMAPPQKPESS